MPVPSDLKTRIERKEGFSFDIDYDSADEKSQITYLRLKEVLAHWKEGIVNRRLKQDNLPPSYTEPFRIRAVDAATPAEAGGTVWAKLFPFLLVMMSLTGAFYPAVDLCAGEKERGTMETLLISPASRAEIVMGKFLTILLASVTTALLNLMCMGLTGMQLARGLAARGPGGGGAALAPPSLESAFWILLLLVPLASFFSAICLALAVLARSMKEGQYYMTPLYLILLALDLPDALAGNRDQPVLQPGADHGGLALVAGALAGRLRPRAVHFFLPVLITTIAYGALAWCSWAIDQFQREDVLFREAERFDLRIWLRHLLRDKEPTPTGGEALFCFAFMLTLAWFLTQYLAFAAVGASAASLVAGSQIAFVLTPPLAMALMLTSSPRQTLRLYWPNAKYLALAFGLALAVNPLVNELRPWVEMLFPIPDELKEMLGKLMGEVPNLPTALLLFALIPAICEEFAFRGFILTGLERGHKTRDAIIMSALLFGFMHVLISLFQQLFNATLLGLILGLLAVRSRSILPGIVFHTMNNGLAFLTGTWLETASGKRLAPWVYRNPLEGQYHYWVVAVAVVATVLLLAPLVRGGAQASKPAKQPSRDALLAAGVE